MKKLHVTNNNGNRVAMSWERLRMINEIRSNPNKYVHDIDWYMNNGYSLIDDVIDEFEDIYTVSLEKTP